MALGAVGEMDEHGDMKVRERWRVVMGSEEEQEQRRHAGSSSVAQKRKRVALARGPLPAESACKSCREGSTGRSAQRARPGRSRRSERHSARMHPLT